MYFSTTINDLNIYFQKYGEGKPLLLLHGWGINSEKYTELFPLLAAQGFRVYALDLPGFGQTKEPTNIWTTDDYVNLIKEFCNAFNIDKCVVLGHSFGGHISIKLANQYPDLVQSLILCSSAGIRKKPSLKKKLFKLIAKTGKLVLSLPLIKSLKPKAEKLLYRVTGTSDYINASDTMKEVMKNVLADDISNQLQNITCPTLILWGSNDNSTPLSDGKIMNEKINNSQFHIIPNADHGFIYKNVDHVRGILNDFLHKYT